MEVPSTLNPLWRQRRRWARGQGEVLRAHLGEIAGWRNRRLWPLGLESVASLGWVVAFVFTTVLTVAAVLAGGSIAAVLLGFAWGISVALVATIQLAFALRIDFSHDRLARRAFALGAIYPVAYWLGSAGAALRDELPAVLRRKPAEHRVVWDLPRDTVR
jgi:biofilm PGA synthesis N-glycosyltransferase PgaC